MSEDIYNRSVALDRAMQHWNGQTASTSAVLETAEKFRAFLAGEGLKPELPAFKLPDFSDEFLYFRFGRSGILYRSDLNYGPTARGGVSRINTRAESKWKRLDLGSRLGTRSQLRDSEGYEEISSHVAAQVIQDNVKDVRFE